MLAAQEIMCPDCQSCVKRKEVSQTGPPHDCRRAVQLADADNAWKPGITPQKRMNGRGIRDSIGVLHGQAFIRPAAA